MLVFLAILVYLAITNAVAYRAFAKDKQFAEANRGIPRDRQYSAMRVPRIPEAKLLFYANIGGWAGAKYAQQKLRHKSYKQPFGAQLNRIGMVQSVGVGTFVVIVCSLLVVTPAATARPQIAVQAVQPAGAPPLISLRPPVVHPAKS